jgi:hypothetical protein
MRALGLALLAFLVTWLLTAATDEGGASWGTRAGRTLPLAPACAALGAWIALAPARARGELVALEALGRSPLQIAAGAVAGGAVVAMVAACAIGAPRAVDVAAFYPVVTHGATYRFEPVSPDASATLAGTFVDDASGLRVAPDGALSRTVPRRTEGMQGLPPAGRLSAALTTALAGVGLPLLFAQALLVRTHTSTGVCGSPASHALGATALMAASSIVLFQAAAARLIPALFAAVPSAALLAWAIQRYRASP